MVRYHNKSCDHWNVLLCFVYLIHTHSTRTHGFLAKYVKLWVAHAPGMPGTFSPSLRGSDTDMHLGTWVTHVPWCMPGSLTTGFLWSRWRGKRSQHSPRMSNTQYNVSGKRPMVSFMEPTRDPIESSDRSRVEVYCLVGNEDHPRGVPTSIGMDFTAKFIISKSIGLVLKERSHLLYLISHFPLFKRMNPFISGQLVGIFSIKNVEFS